MADFDLNTGPSLPPKTDYGIGCVGAGFIMRDIHLVAYREAGFNPVAIASRTPEHARAAAEQNGVGTVYDTWQELLDDERVEIVDIAYPPDQQLEIVREAAKRPHVKGILAQKPVAFTLDEAVEMVRVCDEAGVKLGVNHNMRYDQSMRALKTLLDRGELGERVVAEIVMNARPHWQEFLKPYGRIALLNMCIHHLDVFRYQFGDPERIRLAARDGYDESRRPLAYQSRVRAIEQNRENPGIEALEKLVGPARRDLHLAAQPSCARSRLKNRPRRLVMS